MARGTRVPRAGSARLSFPEEGLPRAARVANGAGMNHPRSILSLLLVFSMAFFAGCNSTKKKDQSGKIALVRFMVEAGPNEAGGTVMLPQSRTTIRVSPKSYFTEYDVVKCEVVDNELGKSLLFQLSELASRDLYKVSALNQGRRIITAVNGNAIGAQRMDAPIGSGYIVTYVEVDPAELPQLAKAITKSSLDAQAELKKKEK